MSLSRTKANTRSMNMYILSMKTERRIEFAEQKPDITSVVSLPYFGPLSHRYAENAERQKNAKNEQKRCTRNYTGSGKDLAKTIKQWKQKR